ncbi:hypothetical protein L4X63_19010 [Geomonas sp. Red32]|uniref:hypothetical protein n=1 Tax=Geomonas sp. Red32 TaxID=2912856 RepID=UPI00202CA863|nr:hypothetical protein [Geomonas sp. Red32]MCM0083681.1 hypothetical protein [Geomonas sp. Red32]
MLKKFLATLLIGTLAAVALTSCGDSKAAGVGQFATVYATATSPGVPLDSDEATWVDATTQSKAQACLATSVPHFASDDVNYSVTSTAWTSGNTGQTNPTSASDLMIQKVILTLTPDDSTTPALPAVYQTQFLTSGIVVPAGSTVSVPVRIVSQELKTFLSNDLLCTGLMYKYRATVSFEAVEVNTNKVATITVPGFVLIRLTDFTDK